MALFKQTPDQIVEKHAARVYNKEDLIPNIDEVLHGIKSLDLPTDTFMVTGSASGVLRHGENDHARFPLCAHDIDIAMPTSALQKLLSNGATPSGRKIAMPTIRHNVNRIRVEDIPESLSVEFVPWENKFSESFETARARAEIKLGHAVIGLAQWLELLKKKRAAPRLEQTHLDNYKIALIQREQARLRGK